MLSTNYEFTARGKLNAPRPRLLSGWALTGFALAVLLLLAMIFPKHELVKQALQDRLGDPLSTNYLVNLLRTDPENQELRLLLAEHQIFLGEMNDVPLLLEPVLRSSNPDWQARGYLAQYKYVTALYLLSEKDFTRQSELLQRRREIFSLLVTRLWPMQTLVYLASQANELGEADSARLLYRQIKQDPRQMSAEWYAGKAAQELGKSHYELAALLYFIARQEARLLANQREYYFAGIKALMANSMFVEAMVSADLYLGNLEDDSATLYFLAQTARAANDTVRADKYARKMVHLSMRKSEPGWFARLQLNPIATARAADDETAPEIKIPDRMRPYDRKTYLLAYEIFLGNRNLADAYRVALAAVRQVPKDAEWHKRLAQVAEWYGRPETALREWRWLSLHGGGEEAMLAVLRLAPELGEYDTLVEAWKQIAARHPLDEAQWRALADLYEQAGNVSDGIAYFEAQYARGKDPLLLELAAGMAQRSGDDEGANKLYWRLIKQHGMNSARLLKVTTWYLQKGRYQDAYDLLKKHAGDADKKDFTYWKLLADLAWQLQHDDVATENYQRLAASGNMAREDFNRLIYLLGPAHRREAAALAEMAYDKYGDQDMLLRALDIHAARNDLAAQKRLFEKVADNHGSDFSGNARFYMMRAQYWQAAGKMNAARADFRHAAAISPGDANSNNAMLWFLIDAHDHQALTENIVKVVRQSGLNNPAYWGALAAACQELGQPARAVAFYKLQLKRNKQDFLWLLGFADALEQNHQPGLAWRVRRQAWVDMHNRKQDSAIRLPLTPAMLAAARLTLLNEPHDPALALVRSVLRQDRLLKRDDAADQLTNELVLGWAASTEQNANAKAWLWKRYGLNLRRPLWAEAMIAVAENDSEKLDRLLAGQAEGLSPLVRHDAAQAMQQNRYAQSIVFEALAADPEDNEAHQRLSDDALATASQVNIELRDEQIGTLHNMVQNLQIETPVSNRARLAVELGNTRQAVDDPLQLADFPPTERIAGLILKVHGNSGDTRIAMRKRDEYAGTTELTATHERLVAEGVNLRLNAEFNAEATESGDMRVFGMRNQFDAALQYAFSKREYVRLQPVAARYYTQQGEFIGSGNHFNWEFGHHLRTDTPALTVKLNGEYTHFASDDASPILLPGDTAAYGVCLGYGESYKLAYTRAWRPFFDYCATNNNVSGQGYNATVGMVGPLGGHDGLAVTLHQEFGSVTVSDGLVRELTVRYRYYFDRY